MFLEGGGRCSICGSEDVNMQTCPLNPHSLSRDKDKHYLANTKSICKISPQADLDKIIEKMGIDKGIFEEYPCAELKHIINNKGCLRGWEIKDLLGIGTVGTVLGICSLRSSRECQAIKLQKVENRKQRETISRESRLQIMAAPHSPKVFNECFFYIGEQEWYAIIMEKLVGEMDAFLSQYQTNDVLDDVANQIITILEYLRSIKLIHGDLVWFNIGYVESKDNVSGIRLVLIDFDRAAENKGKLAEKVKDAEEVDVLRLIGELDPRFCVQPPIMKKINLKNSKYLSEKLIEYAKQVYGGKFLEDDFRDTVDDYWVDLYERYCVHAKIKCLE